MDRASPQTRQSLARQTRTVTGNITPVSFESTAASICAAGMKQLMPVEHVGRMTNIHRTRLNKTTGWLQLLDIFRNCHIQHQKKILVRLKPLPADGANIQTAFDELLDMHLREIVPFTRSTLCKKQHYRSACWNDEAPDYLNLLSNAYSMSRSPDCITYFQEMNHHDRTVLFVPLHWKKCSSPYVHFFAARFWHTK